MKDWWISNLSNKSLVKNFRIFGSCYESSESSELLKKKYMRLVVM